MQPNGKADLRNLNISARFLKDYQICSKMLPKHCGSNILQKHQRIYDVSEFRCLTAWHLSTKWADRVPKPALSDVKYIFQRALVFINNILKTYKSRKIGKKTLWKWGTALTRWIIPIPNFQIVLCKFGKYWSFRK